MQVFACGETGSTEPTAPEVPQPHAVEEMVQDPSEAEPPPTEMPAPSEAPPREAPVGFHGEADAPRLEGLRQTRFARVRRGRGGRSLAFRITFEDGSQAYFKPEQEFSGAHWYSEIAAYHLDRALGFGRVPPVLGARVPWRKLARAADAHPRGQEAVIDGEDMVRGAMIWWIPGRLDPWPLGRGWERFLRFDGGIDMTPYQRPADYRSRINGESSLEETELGTYADAPEELTVEERAQLSDLILFDYLISNVDRWGGEYTNVRRLGSERLVFLDNGAGFWPSAHLGLMNARLAELQRFRRRTYEALQRFDMDDFRARLATDPLHPVLDERQLTGLASRIQEAIAHIDRLRERHGDDVFLDDSQ